jgi:hypothetical protein
MLTKRVVGRLAVLTIIIVSVLSTAVFGVQGKSKKEKKALPQGTPVLWQEPADIESRDLLLGPGGAELKPDLSSVTFVKDEAGGYSVKYRVRDGAGKIWVAKLGNEAQSETAATRLVWAVGYATEVNYLAPCVQIRNAPSPRKKVERCADNGFANVRFEARPEEVKRLDEWSWKSNPFVGTKELQGLVVLMGLLNNWDTKDTNNKILFVPGGEQGGQAELRYIISDLGATFGKTGNAITHNRNQPETFVKTKFIKKVEGDRVQFDYNGKNGDLFKNITVEQASWIGGLLSRLSDQQLSDAFRAANYSPEEIQSLTESVRARINELAQLSGQPGSGNTGGNIN